MIRLFVALPLPKPVRGQVARLAAGIPGARWTPPENLHLTLRFIGGVDGRTYGDVVDALGHVDMPAFDLRLDGVGTFGDRRRVDSLWVGVRTSEPLNRLHGKIEQAVLRAGLDPERRKFHPHVTLARLKSAPEQRLGEFLAAHSLFSAGPFPVREFILFSSFLSHNGAIYQPEATYPLRNEPSCPTISASSS